MPVEKKVLDAYERITSIDESASKLLEIVNSRIFELAALTASTSELGAEKWRLLAHKSGPENVLEETTALVNDQAQVALMMAEPHEDYRDCKLAVFEDYAELYLNSKSPTMAVDQKALDVACEKVAVIDTRAKHLQKAIETMLAQIEAKQESLMAHRRELESVRDDSIPVLQDETKVARMVAEHHAEDVGLDGKPSGLKDDAFETALETIVEGSN